MPRGLISIRGENYAGKSSILQAIGWALFDSSPGTQSAFVRHGAKKARIEVDLLSALDQQRYRITRQLGSSARWYVDQIEQNRERLADKNEQVRAWLQQHLQLNASTQLRTLFEEAVGVPQGNLLAAFLLRPQPRRQHFDHLLGLDDYESAHKSLWQGASSKVEGAGSHINKQIQTQEVKTGQLKGEASLLPQQSKEVKKRKQEVARLKQELAGLDEELTAAREEEERWDTLQAHLQERQGRYDALVQEEGLHAQALAKSLSLLEEAQHAAAACARHQADYQAYCEARDAREACEERRKQFKELEQQRAPLEREIAVVQASCERLAQDLSEAQEASAQLYALGPLCTEQRTLEARLEEGKHQQDGLAKARSALGTLEAERTQNREKIEALQAQIDELEALAPLAAQAEELQNQEQSLIRKLSAVEARQELTKPSLQAASENLCPILREPCLNLEQKGETISGHLAQQREQLQADAETLQAELSSVQTKRKEAEDALAERARIPLLQERLEERKTQQAQREKQLASLRQQSEELEEACATLPDLQAQYKALGDPLPAVRYAQIEPVAQRFGERQQALDKAQTELQTQQKKLDQLMQELAPLSALEATLETHRVQLQTHEEAYQAYLQHQQLAQTRDAKAQEHEEKEARQAALTAEIQEAKQAADEAQKDYDTTAHEVFRQRLLDLQRRHAEQKGRYEEMGERLSHQQQELDKLKAKHQAWQEAQTELASWKQRKQSLELVRAKLKAAGPEMARRTRQQLEIQAQQLFHELIDDPGIQLKLTDSYGLQLAYHHFVREHEALAGSEGLLAALAVRLAILTLASNLQFAFFDEPTIHLDKEHRKKLAEQLCRLHSIPQIIVISHDDSFEKDVDYIVEVTKWDETSQIEIR